MTDNRKQATKRRKPPKGVETPRDREAVLEDFRKVVGPLQGRNRDQTPKA